MGQYVTKAQLQTVLNKTKEYIDNKSGVSNSLPLVYKEGNYTHHVFIGTFGNGTQLGPIDTGIPANSNYTICGNVIILNSTESTVPDLVAFVTRINGNAFPLFRRNTQQTPATTIVCTSTGNAHLMLFTSGDSTLVNSTHFMYTVDIVVADTSIS